MGNTWQLTQTGQHQSEYEVAVVGTTESTIKNIGFATMIKRRNRNMAGFAI